MNAAPEEKAAEQSGAGWSLSSPSWYSPDRGLPLRTGAGYPRLVDVCRGREIEAGWRLAGQG